VAARRGRHGLLRSARPRPWIRPRASRAWSRIWRYVIPLSRRIVHLGFREHLFTEVAAQESWRVQVHLPAEEAAELFLDGKEAQPRNMSGLELDEHVHVAIRTEIVPENRAEQG
jgi:hypothetical protein